MRYPAGLPHFLLPVPLKQELSAAAARFRGLIVLTDPDVAGRQARQALADALPGCLHSFLPSSLATAGAATRQAASWWWGGRDRGTPPLS